MAGRTTIAIAHRLSTIQQADQICILEAGKVVDQGTQQALLDQEGLDSELFIQQQGKHQAEQNLDGK